MTLQLWREAAATSLLGMRRRDRAYEWVRRHPLVPDVALALFIFVIPGVPVFLAYEPGWAHAALGVVTCAALAFRRIRPVGSFAVIAGCGLVQWAADLVLTPMNIVLLLALYTVSGYGPRWASRVGLAVGFVGVALASTRDFLLPNDGTGAFLTAVVSLSAMVVGAWAVGDVRRVRQAYVAELVDRAQQAERERDQQARIAAAEERARIAREMHDVVAHSLSVIVVQADGGRYAAAEDPAAPVKALQTIGGTGRDALAEIRGLLGILRTEDESDERGPLPGLARLPELVTSVRQAGLPVDLDVQGSAQPLLAGRSLALYRVIQEALTNALKHAGPAARARIHLTYHADRVTAEVADDGRGAAVATDGMGHGLLGMQERLSMYGGSVAAGPRSDGGWRVDVEMPYGEEE
jgi:signal transduction histidine kinase